MTWASEIFKKKNKEATTDSITFGCHYFIPLDIIEIAEVVEIDSKEFLCFS